MLELPERYVAQRPQLSRIMEYIPDEPMVGNASCLGGFDLVEYTALKQLPSQHVLQERLLPGYAHLSHRFGGDREPIDIHLVGHHFGNANG